MFFMNTFMSTSTDYSQAQLFSLKGSKILPEYRVESVMLKILLTEENSPLSYINVQEISSFKQEKEILILPQFHGLVLGLKKCS